MPEVEFQPPPLRPKKEEGRIDAVTFLFLYRRKLLRFFPFAGGTFFEEENIAINQEIDIATVYTKCPSISSS